MGPFYFLLILGSLLCFLDVAKPTNHTKNLLVRWITFILILFAAFRERDADWENYYDVYIEILQGHFWGFADIGFNVICFFLSRFFSNPIWLFLVVAAVAVSLNMKSFCRYTPFIFSCILLYFVHNYCLKEMIQIRVGLASSICLLSLYYLVRREKRSFFLLWILAVSIHMTTIIFILAYFADKYLTKKQLVTCFIVSLVIGSLYPLGMVLKTLAGFNERLDAYNAFGDSGYAQVLGIWTNPNTIKSILIFIASLFYYDSLNKNSPYFKIVFSTYCMGLCWLLLFNDFAIIGARMSNILLGVEPVLLSLFYFLFKPNSRWVYAICLIVVAIIIFHLNIAPDKIIPYNFYLNRYL